MRYVHTTLASLHVLYDWSLIKIDNDLNYNQTGMSLASSSVLLDECCKLVQVVQSSYLNQALEHSTITLKLV